MRAHAPPYPNMHRDPHLHLLPPARQQRRHRQRRSWSAGSFLSLCFSLFRQERVNKSAERDGADEIKKERGVETGASEMEENNRWPREGDEEKKMAEIMTFHSVFSPAALSPRSALLPAESPQVPLSLDLVLSGRVGRPPSLSSRGQVAFSCTRETARDREKKTFFAILKTDTREPKKENGPLRAPAGAVLPGPGRHRCENEFVVDLF